MMDEMDEKFHNRVFLLTGDSWCPYPSPKFIEWIMTCPDEEAVRLIKERREKMYFLSTFRQFATDPNTGKRVCIS